MKNVKYFLFGLLCMVCSCVVFAKDEITIDKMIPVYDENSGVIVSEENGVHSVVFNDKDQNVKYNIILKNNTKRDISLKDIILPESPEEFFKYEFVGIDENTILESNSTEEVVLSLETVKTEGWGRNFTLDLTSKVEIMDNVVNPNTSAQELIVLFVSITFITGIVTIWLKNRKVSRYVVLVVMFGSLMSVTYAKDPIILPIKLNVSFESQNVMKKAYDGLYDIYEPTLVDFWDWDYVIQIKNFIIENEMSEPVDYIYSFDVSEDQTGKVMAYLVENEEESEHYDLYLQADGIIYANKDASYYFYYMENLEKIDNLEGLDTSKVEDMTFMFGRTGYNNPNFTLDVSSLDTSNVTDMSYMFSGAAHSSLNFTLDVSNFDTSNVINMQGMFSSTGHNSTNLVLDLRNFDTSKVTDMSNMFEDTGHNSINLVLDLSNFDTSNVINMRGMFSYTGYNSTNLVLDLSSFDTSKVTDMSSMFDDTGYNNPNFTLDVSNFDTSNVTDMSSMFSGVGHESSNLILNLSNFDTSNVTDMSSMFSGVGYNSTNLVLDLSNFDTSNVTDMGYMFHCTGYSSENFTLDVSNFDTSSVIRMARMFYKTGYSSETFTLDVSNFDTSNVTDMSYMFSETGYSSETFTLDVSNFDMSKVKAVGSMFNGAGYNSTKLNTSITINNNYNYSVYDYRNIFKDVAIKPGSNITVNYTSETSDLVDQMIATKSSGANVVKGVQVD